MRISWTFEKIHMEALKYNTRARFKRGSNKAYCAAQKRGILDQVCAHMPPSINEAYSDEELELEAKKYERRVDFQRGSRSHYIVAHRKKNGFLDKICSHMREDLRSGENHPGFKWTYELLVLEALKYLTLTDFRMGSPGAHNTAHTRGIIKEICSHMKPSCGSSFAERELRETIKSVFASARIKRCCRISIFGKPHIKGFDIDIFVPELMKGIEFDGTYWHSPKGLKRSRKHWPDEDILNYHGIKDDYFASIGIEILHIKEENWIKDQQDCIDKCLAFLGTNQSIQIEAA
jgi:hypothetical protein